MISLGRQQEIMNYMLKHRFATVKELAKVIYSSESSIRRDIKILEQQGLVSQIYGGITLPEYTHTIVPFSIREHKNSPEKEHIAKKAAELIFDGATVFLDGSSTVKRILKYISPDKKVTIITNNNELFKNDIPENIRLHCTGGLFYKTDSIFIGPQAENYIKNLHADLLFFSSQAISENGEISDSSEEETSLRRVMLERAEKKYFLCDSSKLYSKRTFQLCNVNEIDGIICDVSLSF